MSIWTSNFFKDRPPDVCSPVERHVAIAMWGDPPTREFNVLDCLHDSPNPHTDCVASFEWVPLVICGTFLAAGSSQTLL
ncbi:hypothetical protein PanWU01x14_146990 [Parasponia andersonii]|uniref:Uncharacterized protein n=1 Tax=Parasponia andersonii TaxID=3476 RepID=A0A2P5CJW8_PARAD|nr:hypothetical protein PanWU01x14_146990 [Parasponia andersonii]